MSDPCAQLQRALGGAAEALTIREIIEDFPSIADLAEFFTGGAPKGSREYRAARRRFERYRRGALGLGGQTRRPSQNFLDELISRFRERRRRLTSQGAAVTIAGQIQISKDRRRRRVNAQLAGECLDHLLELRDGGADCEELLEAFEECMAENFGGQQPHWNDITELDIVEHGAA